jgi:hypothetical protein
MPFELTPPYTPLDHTDASLRERGFAVLAPLDLARLAELASEHGAAPLARWRSFWDDLPLDAHLRDVGQYRRRRHGSFVVRAGQLEPVPHRAHWQPVDYNALHGGIERWFEPLPAALTEDPSWARLLLSLTDRAAALRGSPGPWHVEAHAFRIDTSAGIGRPTPEGAHRDGVDLVAVVLLGAEGIKGGETRVFDATGPSGQRFTMGEPGTTLLLDDARTIHETTPIQPAGDATGLRDTLVLTWRLDGFQDP